MGLFHIATHPRSTLLLITLGLALATSDALAHVEILNIHIKSFSRDPLKGEYVLRFRAITTDYGDLTNLPAKERSFIVRLQLDPNRTNIEQQRDSADILYRRFQENPRIQIGRMSGKGWQPISGRDGEFQSIGLGIHYPKNDTSEESAIVYFLHDNS